VECINLTKRIAIIQGHSDPAGHHLQHVMADAYAEGAAAAGHEVRRIAVARLEFPLLRTQADFETGTLPPALVQARDDMRWAEQWVFLFPAKSSLPEGLDFGELCVALRRRRHSGIEACVFPSG
jgi:hypothetical protein